MRKWLIFNVLTVELFVSGCMLLLASEPVSPASIEEKANIREESSRQITLLTANLFQERFVDRCMKGLPKDFQLIYAGYLSKYDAPWGLKVDGAASSTSTSWSAGESGQPATFNFWLSTKPTDETVQRVKIESQMLYINVDFVDGNKGVDAKLSQLGNRSVREVLKLLDDPTTNDGRTKKTSVPAK